MGAGCRADVPAGVSVGNGVGPAAGMGMVCFVNENGMDARDVVPPAGGGGVFTEEIEPRTGIVDAGAARRGAAGCTGFAFPTESESPCPAESNGLVMSDGTSTCFRALRRTRRAGLMRDKISFSGNGTGMRSLSMPGAKTCGAAWRMSPKGTCTSPCPSWERTLSTVMVTVKSPTVCTRTLGRSSTGRPLRMDWSGMAMPAMPEVELFPLWLRGEGAGAVPFRDGATSTGGGDNWDEVATEDRVSPEPDDSSERRKILFSFPKNPGFTPLDDALMLLVRVSTCLDSPGKPRSPYEPRLEVRSTWRLLRVSSRVDCLAVTTWVRASQKTCQQTPRVSATTLNAPESVQQSLGRILPQLIHLRACPIAGLFVLRSAPLPLATGRDQSN